MISRHNWLLSYFFKAKKEKKIESEDLVDQSWDDIMYVLVWHPLFMFSSQECIWLPYLHIKHRTELVLFSMKSVFMFTILYIIYVFILNIQPEQKGDN